MKQAQFVARHQAHWAALGQWLHTPAHKREGRHAERFAALYRQLCHHLALARRRGYSPQVTERLQALHAQLRHTPQHDLFGATASAAGEPEA